MIAKVQCIVLDCPDVGDLARFYSSLLGGVVNQSDSRWQINESWATLHTAGGMVLAFQGVEEYRPPLWPDASAPQQFHLDLEVRDLDEAHESVIKLGAALLDRGDPDRSWRVYADPAGHPFCLVRH